uniref:Nitronate monooxygenase domain-containing protein n=1 Tax=Mucochytrium quahogii TaxID=96639 RepID=A0A7S2WSP1_9STRA|mmetsp:Transcript_12360/g.22402  ORF Transcript_12360/g.22402 Transcript_12360/m.22402 type:complete len:361 (+) Transcript_12360:91-1173(+)
MSGQITTPLTKLFGIEKPILLAGMNVAAGPELAAAVTNNGGLGVIGGGGYTPKMLRRTIEELKGFLNDKNAPFGVDLLLPQVGGNARKTNYDYTGGTLPELIDIIIEEGAALFVSAVGVPPKWAVDKLHAAKIPVANIIGAPKHAEKGIPLGIDLFIAQGGEGGGHTGDIPTSVLIPKVVDAVRGHKSPLTGEQICVVAAGGIFDGRGLAASISMGADAVWVGTRFIVSKEAGAPPRHQNAVLKAGYTDTLRTIIYTGRPMRVLRTDYVNDWETNRKQEIRELTGKGTVPIVADIRKIKAEGREMTFQDQLNQSPLLMGKCVGAINGEIPTAKEIMDDMVDNAIVQLNRGATLVTRQSKL